MHKPIRKVNRQFLSHTHIHKQTTPLLHTDYSSQLSQQSLSNKMVWILGNLFALPQESSVHMLMELAKPPYCTEVTALSSATPF